MSLRYAILGFLSSTPGTGYDIAREFADGAGSYWQALPSQIYPELRELEALGWIEGDADPQDRMRRRVFNLTPEGDAALQRWVEEVGEYPPERDAERLRLIFLDRSSPEVIRAHLEHHRAHHESRLAMWLTLRSLVERRGLRQLTTRLAARPAEEHALIVQLKVLALEGNIARAELEIAWARDALEHLRLHLPCRD